MTKRSDPVVSTIRGSHGAELHRLNDTGLADIGLTRSDLGRDSRSLFTTRLEQRRKVVASGSYRGLLSTVGAVLLLVLALLSAESRPADHVALISCPLFHPGIMGGATSGEAAPGEAWGHCQFRAHWDSAESHIWPAPRHSFATRAGLIWRSVS